MTTLQAIKFAAQIQIGSTIYGQYMDMVVTKITEKRVYGYNKRWFDKSGKKREISMEYDTLLNPHYNKRLTIKAA